MRHFRIAPASLLLWSGLLFSTAAATREAHAQLRPGALRPLSSTNGGSVFRLLSGAQGTASTITEPQDPSLAPDTLAGGYERLSDGEHLGTGEAIVADGAELGAPLPADPRWIHPYAAGAAVDRRLGGPWQWIPLGMVPWGPKTPLHDRFVGWGEPLQGTSWLNRPLSAGWFAGAMIGDEPISGQVDAETGFFGGYRFGWDYDYYWGCEMRLGAATLGLSDPRGITNNTTVDVFVWDVNLMYYPWGDARWRPYATIGLGLANFDFIDDQLRRFDEALLGIPYGFGIKYRCHEWLVLRLELLNNIAVGSAGLSTMHNISIAGGVEIRFGGHRRSYWPWNPSRQLW